MDSNGKVLEFAKGLPAYDLYAEKVSLPIYKNGCYFVGAGGQVQLYADGTVVAHQNYTRGSIDMDHNLQGSFMCIPTAISNIMWYWNKNGYSGLTSSTFSDVQTEVQNLMGSSTGSNSKIPSTVSSYAKSKGFKGSATSLSASFNSIKNEYNAGRPCLLGFGTGGGYTAPHMTVCCGYYVDSTANYSIVVDGHSSSNVYRVWGSYNDYVGKVVISR